MRVPNFVTVPVFLLTSACGDSATTEPIVSGEFTATVRGDNIFLHNGSERRVHHAATGEEDPARMLWLICAGPDCPALEPGADDSVALAELDLQPDAESLFVHWWQAEPDGEGGFRPDSIRTIRLVL